MSAWVRVCVLERMEAAVGDSLVIWCVLCGVRVCNCGGCRGRVTSHQVCVVWVGVSVLVCVCVWLGG